jgi:hypothetical protein
VQILTDPAIIDYDLSLYTVRVFERDAVNLAIETADGVWRRSERRLCGSTDCEHDDGGDHEKDYQHAFTGLFLQFRFGEINLD